MRLSIMKKQGAGVFIIFFISIILAGCDLRYGLEESNFQLSEDSRFPKWFNLQDHPRKDLKMTVTFYTHPIFKNKVKMVLYGPLPDRKKLMEKIGDSQWHPFTEQQFKEQKKYGVYPNYSIITVDGIAEVFEQRKQEDILYITDDPQITSILKQSTASH